jgi:NAD(P)-dependent dehydrogenase (short-subunit alcohol dehydrogenase family)
MTPAPNDGVTPMDGRTVIITGGNSGVGKATATALAAAGARMVITARREARGQQALADIRRSSGSDDVDLVVFDLADLASVRQGTAELLARCEDIHVLVNNAGLVLSDRIETKDGYEATFATNHLGPFLLTQLLTERLVGSAPARVVTVSSAAHSSARSGLDFDDLQSEHGYSQMRVYARSKLANILFAGELARRLSGSGVTSNALHPGVVATRFAQDDDTSGVMAFGIKLIRPFILTPEQGARTSVYLASSPEVADVTGKYFVKCRQEAPSAVARDQAAASRLWSISEELVGTAAGGAR